VTAPKPLKLCARDGEDLKILACHLQDAILPVSEMAWLPQAGEFVLMVSRFRWEAKGDDGPFERVACGVRIHKVRAARMKGLDLKDRARMLELLTLQREADGALLLHFADNACIRLETPELLVTIEDIGQPWPVRSCPCHDSAGS
jgi:hypothetical protein